MASDTRMPNARVAELSSSVVPFVYFDAAICCGANYGVIQLELAAKTIVPDSSREAGARNEVVVTAHVRCSLAAAANLKEPSSARLSSNGTRTTKMTRPRQSWLELRS
jgi:hypothetical protein